MSGPFDGLPPYYGYYHPQQSGIGTQDETYVPAFSQQQPLAPEYLHQSYTPVDEYAGTYGPAQSGARVRRRVGAAGEHVKHRRTRSGCYTCRNRRVKCDEVRPVCDRCKKGSRECIYPGPRSSSKSKRRDSKDPKPGQTESGSSPSGDEAELGLMEEEAVDPLSVVNAEGRLVKAQSHSVRPTASRQSSYAPSITNAKSPTSSIGESVNSATQTTDVTSASSSRHPSQPQPQLQTPALPLSKRWAELPRDLHFYIDFYRENVNNYHYSFKYDFDEYLQTKFLEIAMGYEPLLYAIIGFAAYQYSVNRKEGKIQDFLGYYNKSVNLLRLSLTKQHKPNVAMLMTVLQLATIEEFLGDWVSLLSHQKAAFHLIASIYTPQTVMQDETSRKVLDWYLRFDLVGGMMSGNGTFLPRQWYETRCNYYRHLSQEQPTNLGALYKERFSENGLVCADAATLWAEKGRGSVSDEEFNARADDLVDQLTGYEARFPALIMDTSHFITDFSSAPARDPDDIVDPYDPQFLYGGPIWCTNLMLVDWWAFEMMFKHQLSGMRRQAPPADVNGIALKMLKMFEAMELYPQKPQGMLAAAQASLGVAGLFVPKDEKHSMWVRRKLATIGMSGYMYPRTFRQKMSNHWGVDLSHWWLPNDEGFPPILRAIRNLVHDRSEGPQRDQMSEDIRDMRGIFNSLSLDANAPAESPSSITAPSDDRGKSRSSSLHEISNSADAFMEGSPTDGSCAGQVAGQGQVPQYGWTYAWENERSQE